MIVDGTGIIYTGLRYNPTTTSCLSSPVGLGLKRILSLNRQSESSRFYCFVGSGYSEDMVTGGREGQIFLLVISEYSFCLLAS